MLDEEKESEPAAVEEAMRLKAATAKLGHSRLAQLKAWRERDGVPRHYAAEVAVASHLAASHDQNMLLANAFSIASVQACG